MARTLQQDRDRKKVENDEARAIEIGQCVNPARRSRAIASLWTFGNTYFAHHFYIECSPMHRDLVDGIEYRMRNGGEKAEVWPRGSAKTTWFEIATLWAVLSGLRKFMVLVCANESLSTISLDRIKSELETNDLLACDFPEACDPVIALEGINQRAKNAIYQTPDGIKRCGFIWKTDTITLPDIDGAPGGGAIIFATGIEGSVRGLKFKHPRLGSVRPDGFLVDDPQTPESAKSPSQVKSRLLKIKSDLLGLAGPRRKIAGFVAGTVIARGDVMDQLTDHDLNPSWDGRRVPMVSAWSGRHDDLWLTQYAELRKSGQRNGDQTTAEANAFYAANRSAMDAGCSVYWPARFNADEASGIQHAYNLLIDRGPDVFYSEFQGDPKPQTVAAWTLDEATVQEHLSRVPRAMVPDQCTTLTVSCDVNLYGINWTMQAWTEDAAGYVVDWGKFPAGETPLWNAQSSVTEEQAIFAGLMSVADEVMTRRVYLRHEAKDRVYPSVFVADCGYKKDAVAQACAAMRMRYGALQVIPVRALTTKVYRPSAAIRKGDGWHTGRWGNASVLFINADVFRERMQKGFLLPVGSPGGSLSLYGADPTIHRVLAEHVCAEQVVDVLHGERMGTVYVWSVTPGRKNDLADATTYGVAAAAYGGVQFGGIEKQTRKRIDRGRQVDQAKPVDTPANIPAESLSPARPMRHKARGRRGFVNGW